jgi:tripeptide aminopeptidase
VPKSATTEKPLIDQERLLSRFLRHVQIDSSADPSADEYPSSSGQLTIGSVVAEQLRGLHLQDVEQDDHGLVWATVPATDGGDTATVALIAHLDTSPEAPADGVRPNVIRDYAGGDIELEHGAVIRQAETPELASLVGTALVTTDGSTLLGGDDKAGVAILVELAAHLMEHPELPHGPVRLLFTCDEEIGHGTDHIDLDKLGASVAYTLDGGGAGQLDTETFSADAAQVIFGGRNIHPAIAKDRMINAVRAASRFVDRLPFEGLAPETTTGRQGFIHPTAIEGGVGEVAVQLLLRSFETDELSRMAEQLRTLADGVAQEFPGLTVEVRTHRQYRNFREGLAKLPEALGLAEQAYANLGIPSQRAIIRGGTDGSQLTEKGLPTPNLSSGQHNIHALTEFVCLDEMVTATEHLVELLRLWSERSRS